MIQEAIQMHAKNIDVVASHLDDYSATDLQEEYQYMLDTHGTVVLGRDISGGFASVSYVITTSMYEANGPGIPLNDHTYVEVNRF